MPERTCVVEGCGVVHRRIVMGMCSKHLQRFKIYGTTEDRPPRRWIMCSHPECSRQARRGGLCRAHSEDPSVDSDARPPRYARMNARRGTPYCVFLGCARPHKTSGLCHEHREQSLNPSADRDAPTCSWRECETPSLTRGLCPRHVHFRYLALRQYGMTIDQYEAMLVSQGGGCAICGGVNANGSWLAVDHDHNCCPDKGVSCGRCIRALLCANCNLMIGQSSDNPERLRAAAEYLESRSMERAI